MNISVMDLIAEAKAVVPTIEPKDLLEIMTDENVLIIDVRDHPEVVATGKIEGALHVPRGVLEFQADEATPHFDPRFSKDKTIVLYCASGGRSALCGQALLALGYQDVRSLGAFKDWTCGGGPIEQQ